MSIWCSLPSIGHDNWHDGIRGGEVRSYANGWSNHYPTTDGDVEQPACVDLATIPAWCVPGNEDRDGGGELGPWLRLSAYGHEHDPHAPTIIVSRSSTSVVMSEPAVRQLVADLTEWLETPKVHPKGSDL